MVKYWTFSSCNRKSKTISTSIQHCAGSPSHSSSSEENLNIRTGKEKKRFCHYFASYVLNRINPKESINTLRKTKIADWVIWNHHFRTEYWQFHMLQPITVFHHILCRVDALVAKWWRICLPSRRLEFDPCVGKIPWRRKWRPTLVFLPGESHEQRSLTGYSPWGHKGAGHDLPLHNKQQQQNALY